MKTIQKLFITAILVLSQISYAQANPSVEDIIKQNLEAKGGAEKWDAVKTIKMKGTMTMGPMEFPFEMIQKRPNKIYTSFEVQGMTGKQVFDGKIGWMLMPFMGKTEAEVMADDQLKGFKKQADMDGPLRNFEEKGNKVEYVGETEIEGTPVIELKVTDKEGDVSAMFLDKEFMLEIKVKSKMEMMGQTIETDITIGNYEEIDGLVFPKSISTNMGAGGNQEITITSIELNVDVDDSIFEMPAPKAKPEAEETKKQK